MLSPIDTDPDGINSELDSILKRLPANTVGKPHTVKLNVSDLRGFRGALNANRKKYVHLDLSGSTFTEIPANAFYRETFHHGSDSHGCSTLTGITIPDSVTYIGEGAFFDCKNLAIVSILDSVINIGDYAFGSCTSLTDVILGNGVNKIGRSAFTDCTSLAIITIPDSVTDIGYDPFRNCSSLMSISVTDGNSAYSSVDGILYNKDKTVLLQCPGGKTGTVTIPDSVTSIGGYAFSWCTSLTSVIIPDSVTNIEHYMYWLLSTGAFSGCTSLTGITIPDSVTGIGDYTFYACHNLASVTIGNNVTSIGGNAFDGCSNLTSVIIGNSVTDIGNEAFSWCTSLTSITIPASVTKIKKLAFSACFNLASVTFGGTIPPANFENDTCFLGDLRDKFYATNKANGTPGTYTTANPGRDAIWTRK